MTDEREEDPPDIERWMGRIEGKIDEIQRTQERHEAVFGALPCREHGNKIAALKAVSGVWGVIGGTLAVVGAWIVRKL